MADSEAVSPIGFDRAAQLEGVLERIWATLDGHIEAAMTMQQPQQYMDRTALRRMVEEEIQASMAELIRENITVKGLTWEEHEARAHQATQPIDKALLRATIQAQDAALQMSSLSCSKRVSKPALLTSQVDTRISKVVKSGEDKSGILEEQRKRREARRRVTGGEVTSKEQTTSDLQGSDALLHSATQALARQTEKVERAASVAADVERLIASQRR